MNDYKKAIHEGTSKYCKCGCGQVVLRGNSFINGHNAKLNPPLKNLEKGRKKYNREIRNCACGCGETFEVIITSIKKFVSGHNLRVSHFRTISREIRECACGCGWKFEVKINSKKQYFSGHNSRVNHPTKKQREIRVCECGCDNTFECKINSKQRFICGHNMKTESAREKKRKLMINYIPWNKDLTMKTDFRIKSTSNTHKKSCMCWRCQMIKGLLVREKNPMFGVIGKNHPCYIDGNSSIYPLEFNDILKEQIRERDNRICQVCGKTELKNGKKVGCTSH